jgi:hypothetical protein
MRRGWRGGRWWGVEYVYRYLGGGERTYFGGLGGVELKGSMRLVVLLLKRVRDGSVRGGAP